MSIIFYMIEKYCKKYCAKTTCFLNCCLAVTLFKICIQFFKNIYLSIKFSKFLWYNFSKDEIFNKETLFSENAAKCKDFTMPKGTSSAFFLSIKFCIKRILTTTEYCNLQ